MAGLFLIYKRLHSRAERREHANVERRLVHKTSDHEPDANGVMTVLPESADRFIDGLSGRSPLRVVLAHALTRRILGAVPLYAFVVFLCGGINARGGKASPTVAYFRGIIVSFGFNATLWPTDKGVRSRSWFRIMAPLNFLRAIMVTRAVALEMANVPVYVSRVGTVAHYVAASLIALAPWTSFVLDVRGKNRWAYVRFLRSLSAGSMLAAVVVLRCTALGPHSSQFPPCMRSGGFPFHIAVARPTFVLVLNALQTPANRQALASLADRMGLTHVPIHLSQIRSLTDARDVWSLVQRLMHPSRASANSSSDRLSDSPSAIGPQARRGVSKEGGSLTSESHHTSKLPAGAAYVLTPPPAAAPPPPPEVPEAASEVPAAAPEAPEAASEVPAAVSSGQCVSRTRDD